MTEVTLLSVFGKLGNTCQFPFFFIRWPVRTVSFNHTGEFLAYASEDPFIDIVMITNIVLFLYDLSLIVLKNLHLFASTRPIFRLDDPFIRFHVRQL